MHVGICEWTTFPASFEDELAAYLMSDDGTFGNAFPDSLWALPVDELARKAVDGVVAS